MSHKASAGMTEKTSSHDTKGHQSGDLRIAVRLCIEDLERKPGESFKFASIAHDFGIKVRRVYDMINIFSAIGCCQKSGPEGVIWIGLSHIQGHLSDEGQSRGMDNPLANLLDLFPVTRSVGIAKLTIDYLMLYCALRTQHLDLKMVAMLLSRGRKIFRSTLSKLYQISFILCAAGIASRSALTCDVVLLENYIFFDIVPVEKRECGNPADFETMLNRPAGTDLAFIYRRRNDLFQLWGSSSNNQNKILSDTTG
jgi:hypothetical protein